MRKIYVLVFILFTAHNCFAQISLTATAGATGPVAYTTLKAAFDAVNAGTHQGSITVGITGNTTETASAVLNASGSGSASYSLVSVKPTGGTSVTISGDINGPLIDLNGADNVVINGLNNEGNSLVISNNSIHFASSTIRFINDASTDSILNTTIRGADTSITGGNILFGTGTVTGNDNNVIFNCNINEALSTPTNAIYSAGSSVPGQENSNVKISGCFISNFFNAGAATSGITLAAGNTDWIISENRFFQNLTRTYTVAGFQRIIQITSGNNHSITGNIIGYSSAAGIGVYTITAAVATRFIGIDLAVGTTAASSIQNNTIAAFSFTTSANTSTGTGIWCGINITTGNVNIGTSTGNTIGNTGGTNSILVTPTVAGTMVTAITSTSTGNINISNNSIGSITLQPTAALSGNIYTINFPAAASGTYTVNNNIIGNSIPHNISVGTVGVTTGSGIVRAVFNVNSGTVSITSNTIQNLTHNSSGSGLFRAIEFQQGTGILSNNNISQITSNGTFTFGSGGTPVGAGILATTSVAGLLISQNNISNLILINTTASNSNTVIGVYLGGAVTNASVTKNVMHTFLNAGTASSTTAPAIMAGIYCRDAGASNPNILLANNMIALGNGQGTNSAIIGIWNGTVSANGLTTKIYYNSVNIEGHIASGAQPSFCYYRGDFGSTIFTTAAVDIKNNIFTNSRNGGTGKHYAIANGYPNSSSAGGWGAGASNYNVLNAAAATVGYWSGDQTFAGWQTASASDANSLSGIVVNYVSPGYDLHLTTNNNSAVDGKGTPVAGQTIDIDNDPRDAATPDPGADEFTFSIPVIFEYFKGKKQGTVHALNWKAFCTSPSVVFEIERSTDTRRFEKIGSIIATQARSLQPFDFAVNNPLPGTNYYRLKMTESDGAISYSIIIAIINKDAGLEILSLMPTLVDKDNAVLNVSAAQNTKLDIVISSIDGKIVSRQSASLTAGSSTVQVNMGGLAAGTYQLSGYTAAEKARTIRFIKL